VGPVVVADPGSSPENPVVCDVQALACPLSLLRVKRMIHELPLGSVVSVLCADPWTALDVEVWARRHRLHVLDCSAAPAFVQIRLPALEEGFPASVGAGDPEDGDQTPELSGMPRDRARS
jgi:TusA-related sulfurtransferase